MGIPLFGQDHVDRYRETGGEEGHDWQGTTVLLLTTTGRKPGTRANLVAGQPEASASCMEAANASGPLLRRRLVHPHELPAVAVEVEEAA